MPQIGFGTYKLREARQAVILALTLGYRQIETAFIYSAEKTEPEVGYALAAARASGLAREEVFVTTKHWRKYHGFEPSIKCLELSLKRLQLEYVDLCALLHDCWSHYQHSYFRHAAQMALASMHA
eukprot:6198772-Pleurochrysis_carterae.AAC.3